MVEYGSNPMEMTPSQQFLAFVLQRSEDAYKVMSDPLAKELSVEYSVTALLAFIPDVKTRRSLYVSYFTNKKEVGIRTAALLVTGEAISSLALSLGIADVSVGGFA